LQNLPAFLLMLLQVFIAGTERIQFLLQGGFLQGKGSVLLIPLGQLPFQQGRPLAAGDQLRPQSL